MIIVEKSKCILCGVCEGLAPRIFKQTTSVAVDVEEAKKDMARAYLCVEACPTEAIVFTDK